MAVDTLDHVSKHKEHKLWSEGRFCKAQNAGNERDGAGPRSDERGARCAIKWSRSWSARRTTTGWRRNCNLQRDRGKSRCGDSHAASLLKVNSREHACGRNECVGKG